MNLVAATTVHSKTRNRKPYLPLVLRQRSVLQCPGGGLGRLSGMKSLKADQTTALEPTVATPLDRVQRRLRARKEAPCDASPAVAILLARPGMLQWQHSFDSGWEAIVVRSRHK